MSLPSRPLTFLITINHQPASTAPFGFLRAPVALSAMVTMLPEIKKGALEGSLGGKLATVHRGVCR